VKPQLLPVPIACTFGACALFLPGLYSVATSGLYGPDGPAIAVTAALLLALVAAAFMLACTLLALRMPALRVSTRIFVSIAAGVAVAIAGALSFVPLALLLQLGRFTLPSVSRPLAELEQLVYAVAVHEYTVVGLLVAFPAGALFVFWRTGGRRPAPHLAVNKNAA
jgi:hypothetical protein